MVEHLRSPVSWSMKEYTIGYNQGMEGSGDRGERRELNILEIQMKTNVLG